MRMLNTDGGPSADPVAGIPRHLRWIMPAAVIGLPALLTGLDVLIQRLVPGLPGWATCLASALLAGVVAAALTYLGVRRFIVHHDPTEREVRQRGGAEVQLETLFTLELTVAIPIQGSDGDKIAE